MNIIKFEPLTDEQYESVAPKARVNTVFEKGTYSFKITSAEQKTSKSGNLMIEIKMLFIDFKDGQERTTWVVDWLMPSGDMAYRLKNFCEAVGLSAQYEIGEISAEQIEGLTGMAHLYVKKGEPKKDGSGTWPDKNSVAGYVVEKDKVVSSGIVDDELPF